MGTRKPFLWYPKTLLVWCRNFIPTESRRTSEPADFFPVNLRSRVVLQGLERHRRLTRDSRNRRLTRDFRIRPKIVFYNKTENFHRKNDQQKITNFFVHLAPEKI